MDLTIINKENGSEISLDLEEAKTLISTMDNNDLAVNYKAIKEIIKKLYELKNLFDSYIQDQLNEEQTIIQADGLEIKLKKGSMTAYPLKEDELKMFLLNTYPDLTLDDIGKYEYKLSWSKCKELIKRGYIKLKELFKQDKDTFEIKESK